MADVLSYSEDLKKAIHIAQRFAKEFSNSNFSSPHLLKGLLHDDTGLRPFIESLLKHQTGFDYFYLEEWADIRLESYPKASKITEQPPGDDKLTSLMDEADTIRIKLSKDEIDPVCALAGLCIPGLAFSYEQLKTFPLSYQQIIDAAVEETTIGNAVKGGIKPIKSNGASPSIKTNALLKYCIDKTEIALEGKLDPIIGREKEIRMVSEILGRRSKRNVIITGEPGVGKTALIDGFALNIINNKVPLKLRKVKIFALDIGALIAGASYKGEVEDRLKNIIKEIKQFEHAILFIDEMHMLLDERAGAAGAANILKPDLARGELTVIGATTNEEYRKFIEKDEAFNRRFELLRIEEPDDTTCREMIAIIVPYLENHHEIKLNADAIPESIRLARRYIKDRKLPDAAIDLIDRAMAVVKMTSDSSLAEIESITNDLNQLIEKKSEAEPNEFIAKMKWLYNTMKNRISPILFNQIEETDDNSDIVEDGIQEPYIRNILDQLKGFACIKKETVDKNDIIAIVSDKTGIPMGKIQSREKERLENLELILKKRVVGQDHAIEMVANSIRGSRSGLSPAGKPVGSFFLLGPTGTGKTELAKSLAEFLFADERALIRFDMSEFKEAHSAALLYGAPPGYIGYQEGGMLVNKIRQQPYAIVLFDEIEKAHPSVFDCFLQIMDEGKFHDKLGKEGDFSNAVILFTSNLGSKYIMQEFENDRFPPPTNELRKFMGEYFKDEFLGRIEENGALVPFKPISKQVVLNIFDIQLKNLFEPLSKQGITLNISKKAKEFLANLGFDPKYGARPLKGLIRNQLSKPISKMIISGQVVKGDVINLEIDNKKELNWSVKKQGIN